VEIVPSPSSWPDNIPNNASRLFFAGTLVNDGLHDPVPFVQGTGEIDNDEEA